MAARRDSVAANVLGLKLVHELVTGKPSVEQARHLGAEHRDHNLGRDAPSAERLLFEGPQGGTQDLDEGKLAGALRQELAGRRKEPVAGGEEAADRRTPA